MATEVLPRPIAPPGQTEAPARYGEVRVAVVRPGLAAIRRRMRLVAFAATAVGVVPWAVFATLNSIAIDAHAYFVGAYQAGLGGPDAYLYSPAFSQAVEPLRWLGWEGFRAVWRLLEVAALTVMAGPLTGPLLFVNPVALEVEAGNIHLLTAAAIIAGFRWPAAWSFVLLTKVTPGIGLIWFAVRREWRSLAIALGATAAIALVSFVLAPSAWVSWLSLLMAQSGGGADWTVVTLPLLPRLIAAAALVAWGAVRDYRWTVLVAATLAMPSVWLTALSMAVGLIVLQRRRRPVGVMAASAHDEARSAATVAV